MLNPDQLTYLTQIEQLIANIRTADQPCLSAAIPVTGSNLQAAINAAPAGSALDLLGKTFTQAITIDKPLTLLNGTVLAPVNTNDLINITGNDVKLRQLYVVGDNATTKNGIVANGRGLELTSVRVHDIGRPGIETHALVTWNGGEIVADDCTFYAGSIAVLFGGNGTTIPNYVPSDCSFNNCDFGRPVEWKGRFGSKTIMEFKNARNIRVTNSRLHNNWQEGPQGHAITITASNYDGNSPLTITENIVFDTNQITNVNGGVLALGYGQHHPGVPTLRGNHYQFLNNNWQISKALNGGQGALLTTGCELLDILFEGNTHESDGDAMIRVNDVRIGAGLIFRNNPSLRPGTYGVFGPSGSRGANFHAQFLDSMIEHNTFVNAHSLFKTNFPNNEWRTV